MKSLRQIFKPNKFPAKTSFISTSKTLTFLFKESSTQNETQFITLIHSSKTTKQLRQIHAHVITGYFLSSRITTQLISSSSLLKFVDYAISIFQTCTEQNLYIFNALIRGLTENSRLEWSVYYFVLMLRLNVKPDTLTYPYVLKSTAGLGLGGFGRSLHCRIMKSGVEFDSFVRVSMVDMYVKFEEVDYALKVFDESSEWNKNGSILLWNVLINGCCLVGDLRKAYELFEDMPERNTGSYNCLINGFMRIGNMDGAKEIFDRIPEKNKNVVSWTTMVHGLSQNGDHEEALTMFTKMLEEGDIRPNDVTIVSALSACAKIGALESGIRVHDYIMNNRFRMNVAIGNALVDMYSKCGDIESASMVFNQTKDKDILTWSVMIRGWAIHGRFDQAMQCFRQMMYSGVKPDGVTFLALLTACSHSGQVKLGLNFFESMRLDYYIDPTLKHYALIVDMFGRAGQLNEALKFIEKMPITPDFAIWGALFCACRAHKNIKMAELTSKRLLQLEPKHPGSYIFLSNIYAAAGRWEDVEKVRTTMNERGLEKDPGWSYIELDGKVHSFVAGDRSHIHAKYIYLKLDEITCSARQNGYVPETGWVLHNIEEEEKEDALGSHSEKLALAFGIVSSGPGKTLRIVKNLRVCGDCHSIMKYASKMCRMEIVLRDIKRFHHFKDGICTCGDYW